MAGRRHNDNQHSAKPLEATKDAKKNNTEENVSPAEHLMREDGVLDRVLLIYEGALTRIDMPKEVDPASLREEDKLFSEEGFEKIVAKVNDIERDWASRT